MAKIIVTYNEVIELNQILHENKLKYKLHLHDTCGSQSFTLEGLGNSEENQTEKLEQEVKTYFERKGIAIRFFDDHQGFVII